jgi:hypothetical protein
MRSTIVRQIARPMPIPPFWKVSMASTNSFFSPASSRVPLSADADSHSLLVELASMAMIRRFASLAASHAFLMRFVRTCWICTGSQ